MKFGLSEDAWALVESLAIDPLKKSGARVWVFGSRARGTHAQFSDLDLLFDAPVGLGALGMIRENLEESNLPIKVDLVNLRDMAESYKASILRDRIEV